MDKREKLIDIIESFLACCVIATGCGIVNYLWVLFRGV